MVIGVTGKYCSGKTTISQYFHRKGFEIISVDKIAHEVLNNSAHEIIEHFGKDICDDDTQNFSDPSNINDTTQLRIDRKKLGKIVFSSNKKLQLLESIVHPKTVERVTQSLTDNHDYLIDAALLHYLSLDSLCSIILIVHSHPIIRFFRALKRDKLGLLQVIRRFRSQNLVPDKKYFHSNKKLLNLGQQSSEILVSGTCSFLDLAKKLDDIVDGAKNGRKNPTK